MAYYTGDIPVEDIVIEPAPTGHNPDLTEFDEVAIQLRNPEGVIVDIDGFVGVIEDDNIVISWPDETPFVSPGIYTLTATITASDGPQRERIRPLYLVAQNDDGWHTVDSAREVWPDATDDDARLHQLLDLARQQVTAYAPALLIGTRAPANYREAQIMQCRNIWNAGKVDPASGGFGEDSFVIRPFPLDWMIKQILRPRTPLQAAH